MEGVGYLSIEIIGYGVVVGIVGRVQRRHQRIADRRREEVAVARGNASRAGPGQVCTAVGGVVYAHHDLSRKHVLNAQIPLIDLGVASGARVQVAGVAEAPLR